MNQETSNDPTIGQCQHYHHPRIACYVTITGGTKSKTSIDWPCLPIVDVLIKVRNVPCSGYY